jgi:hypothetical protein
MQKELLQLQERGAVVHADLRRSHRSLYEHLATLYLWWRNASEIDGYLDREYAALNLKARTVAGINFRPLLVLVWGFNSVTSQQTALHSRTLNAIHDEYETRPTLYAKDGVAKLVNFIEQAGGATKLAGYGQQDDDENDDAGERRRVPLIDPEVVLRTRDQLLRDARKHAKFTPMAALPPVNGIDADTGELGLMLVKSTAAGMQVVTYQNNSAIIDEMLVATYRRRFEVQHPKVRPLLELLQTQCLPKHLEGLQNAVEGKKLKKGAWAKGAGIGPRRVLYRHETGSFVLSSTGTNSGVVSCVTPHAVPGKRGKHAPFTPLLTNCGQDVFMAPAQRTELETRCLRDFAFNLFDVGAGGQVASYAEPNSASHLLTLTHIANKRDRLHLPFWPFYTTLDAALHQVVPNPGYSFMPVWAAKLSPTILGRLDRQFVSPWLASHAKHFTRDKHAVIQVKFGASKLKFDFVFQNDAFENTHAFAYHADCGASQSIVVQFASIDLMPMLASLALLPLDGAAQFALDANVLRIAFQTIEGGPLHEIHIPTLDQDSKRSEAAFTRYKPELVVDPSGEAVAA